MIADIHAKLAAIRALTVEVDAMVDTIGVAPGFITYPQNNYVFQKSGAVASFTATKNGTGSFRLKQGSAIISENTSGVFSNIPVGWYSLVLVNNGAEGVATRFGVGRHLLIAGQSNGISWPVPNEYTAQATREGLCLVGLQPAGESTVMYRDAYHDTLDHGMMWVHMANALASLNEPIGFTIIAVSNTSIADWSSVAYKARMTGAIQKYKPGMVIWTQGEADGATGGTTLNSAMWSIVANSHTAAGYNIPWAINICAPPYDGNYDVVTAQDYCKWAPTNTHHGINMGYNQAGNRGLRGGYREQGEVHFRGTGNTDATDHLLRLGADFAARYLEL